MFSNTTCSQVFWVFKSKYAGHRFIGLLLDLFVRPLENAFEIILCTVGTMKILTTTYVLYKTRNVISTKQTLIKKKIPYP